MRGDKGEESEKETFFLRHAWNCGISSKFVLFETNALLIIYSKKSNHFDRMERLKFAQGVKKIVSNLLQQEIFCQYKSKHNQCKNIVSCGHEVRLLLSRPQVLWKRIYREKSLRLLKGFWKIVVATVKKTFNELPNHLHTFKFGLFFFDDILISVHSPVRPTVHIPQTRYISGL